MKTEIQSKYASKLFTKAVSDYPADVADKLLLLKSYIYEQAQLNPKIGKIEESFKWGNLSYVSENRSGTPIRIASEKKPFGFIGLYVNCSTTVISDIKLIYGDRFLYDGNRALLFAKDDQLPEEEIRHVIDLILGYHLNKKSK